MTTSGETTPTVLFLCVHNAGRSQMALGWFDHLAQGRATAFSGGSEPAEDLNPTAVAAMAERLFSGATIDEAEHFAQARGFPRNQIYRAKLFLKRLE